MKLTCISFITRPQHLYCSKQCYNNEDNPPITDEIAITEQDTINALQVVEAAVVEEPIEILKFNDLWGPNINLLSCTLNEWWVHKDYKG